SHGNVSVGQVNLAVNLVIYAVCLFLFDVQTVVYSVIFAVVHAFAIDKFHSQNINVEVKIITKTDPAVIEQDVFTNIVRGVTELRSVGAYTHEEEHILYIIISKYEVHQLRQIVRKHDKNAFIIVNEGVWVEGHFLKKL
ncbi:MAG: YitT family protein, partial [Spirochaetales bacterium]|nr:YitT family protein [Spirochaetales bacterium]